MRDRIIYWIRENFTIISNHILDFIVGLLVSSHPEWNPRVWSNKELKNIARYFVGNVVNVSAAEDSDKNGCTYRSYFPGANSYSLTNYGFGEEGLSISKDEKLLNLNEKYRGEHGKFDVVLNHTVMEHLRVIDIAFDNICALSDDIVITIVPSLMGFHGRIGSYTDYWRFTPMSLISEFEKRGFSTIYLNWNRHHPLMNVYVIHVASRYPERHCKHFDKVLLPRVNEEGPGVNFSSFLWGWGRGEGKTNPRKMGEYLGCRMIPKHK